MVKSKMIAGEQPAPPPAPVESLGQPLPGSDPVPNFPKALESFMSGLQSKMDAFYKANYEKSEPPVMSYKSGPKYVKVIRDGGSVYAFIDKSNGNVLKPASWQAPAKHARGNVFAPDNGLNCCGPFSVAYLK
jgi:hypothetical protein